MSIEMPKVRYLSAEYLAELEKRGPRMPARPGLHVEIQYHIKDVPDGEDIKYYFRIHDGRLTEARLGTLEKSMCSLTMSYKNSVKVTTGELRPLVGLMTGRVRPSGDLARLRSMVPTLETEEFKALSSEVHDMTEY
ncbi:hypothetical protein Psuf_005060 [Phytohabitans suffuscus]|uniref:SCP2 domain-containing protein n=1 Tax=Phytohabitans suffuscus TaxID=624315 RepID=A0A6F8YAZ2_9ACTN|nr:hypothetical protein Psuf_005060 [Phytohabitans suffuscus]